MATPYGMAISWSTLRICAPVMPIIRSVSAVCSTRPSAVRNTPAASAQTPSRVSRARSRSVAASYTVDSPGAHCPMPTTPMVTVGILSNARARSGWRRSARAVAGSGTRNGAKNRYAGPPEMRANSRTMSTALSPSIELEVS